MVRRQCDRFAGETASVSAKARRSSSGVQTEALESRRLMAATMSESAVQVAATAAVTLPARQVENLDRGLIALHKGNGSVYLSWRLLGLDPSNIGFNVYRSVNGAAATKLNGSPITATTDYTSNGNNTSNSNAFFVRPVVNGVEQVASKTVTISANSTAKQYLSIPLVAPPNATTPDGVEHVYSANDASVADLDGDGEYEVLLKWVGEDGDAFGYTPNMYVDAYKLDGTRLWRIDLGKNIKAGAQFMQFLAYDLDGDGKAEVAMNTADGAVSGTGQIIGSATADYRTATGYTATTGPEFLTIFNGLTGAILASTNLSPARGSVTDWGDNYGHRSTTFNATIAYLDGQRPSIVFGRGIYHAMGGSYTNAKTELVAWDWRNGQLTKRWTFTAREGANAVNPTYVGQGNHNISVGDVDGDGKDEILWGAMAVNDNGAPLYSTRLGHGDAFHLADMDPSRPGLETFSPHESPTEYTRDTDGDGVVEDNGGSYRDAATGEVLFGIPGNGADVGRGVAMDIDPAPGFEMWTSADDGIWNVNGTRIQDKPSNMFQNFGIWWDADLYREMLDATTISDWNVSGGTGTGYRVNFDLDPSIGGVQQYAPGSTSNNSTKQTPALSGDILGDWREEVMFRTTDSTELRIFSTIIPAANRMVTLMHDVQYRESIAWQQNYYNQPPQTSFFLGNGMTTPPTPNVYYGGVATVYTRPDVYQAELAAYGGGVTLDSNNTGFNGTAFANFPAAGGYVQFNNVDGGIGGMITISFRNALGVTASRTGKLTVNGVAQNATFTSTTAWTNWTLYTVTVPLTPGAVNTIRLESTGQDLANIDELRVNAIVPNPPPTLSSIVIDDGTTQRSMVRKLAITFDRSVTLGSGAVEVKRNSTGALVPLVFSNPSGDGRTYVVTFTGSGIVGGSLADGIYTLTLRAAAVRDAYDQALAGGDQTITVHRFYGDNDGDRDVDNLDALRFRQAQGSASGQAAYRSWLDFDADGDVDNLDALRFRQRQGTSIS